MFVRKSILQQADLELTRARNELRDVRQRLTEAESARRHEAVAAEQRIAAANKAAEIAQNNFEWARLSLNRVEQERALLLSHALKFPVSAIEIARQTPFDGVSSGVPNLPNRNPYDDIGDEEASRLGVTHDDEGRVTYKDQ